MRYARVFFVIVILACTLETIRLWFITPDPLAAHFNIQGIPDRFVSKPEFFSFEVQTFLVVIALSLVTQVFLMILPPQWINMPHREYWLAPERREATVDRMSSFSAALFAFVLLTIQAGFELAVSANLQKPILFSAQMMFAVIIGLLIVELLMLFWLAISFRLPSENT